MIDEVNQNDKKNALVKIGDTVLSEKSFEIIITEVLAYLKKEQVRKTKEGYQRNGTRPGRPMLSQAKQEKLKTMIAEGKKNVDIERELKLSPKTVRKYRKLLLNEGGKPNEGNRKNN